VFSGFMSSHIQVMTMPRLRHHLVSTPIALGLICASMAPGRAATEVNPIIATTNDGALIAEPTYSAVVARALTGDADAARRLASHAFYGVQNEVRGFIWLRYAAHSGSREARLAVGYQFQERVDCRSVLEADYWLRAEMDERDPILRELDARAKACDAVDVARVPAIEAQALEGDMDSGIELAKMLAQSGNDQDSALGLVWTSVLLERDRIPSGDRDRLRRFHDVLVERVGDRASGRQLQEAARDLTLQLDRSQGGRR
jgi:hypothetical protein